MTRAVLSALDAVLVAEKKANIVGSKVQLTASWTFQPLLAIDGTNNYFYGFTNVKKGVANPSIAGYKPISSLQELQDAYKNRWINSIDADAPRSFVNDQITEQAYEPYKPHKWIIAGWRLDQGTTENVMEDVAGFDTDAQSTSNHFGGVVVANFQMDPQAGISDMDVYMFQPGKTKVADVTPCYEDPRVKSKVCPEQAHVMCLDPTGAKIVATELAKKWNGTTDKTGLCSTSALVDDVLV